MKRGRPSAASREVMALSAPLERVERQKPPHDLTDEEVEIWSAVVATEPADWFSPSTVPLLAQYCRHCVHARRIGELLEQATGDRDLKIEDYDRLLKMQDREGRAMSSLATKMRLSQQSTINHRANKRPSASIRPWAKANA